MKFTIFTESSFLEKINLNAFTFSDEILKIIEKSFLRPDSKLNLEYKTAHFVNNRHVLNKVCEKTKKI